MIGKFRSPVLGASHRRPAWCALFALNQALPLQSRLKLSPNHTHPTIVPESGNPNDLGSLDQDVPRTGDPSATCTPGDNTGDNSGDGGTQDGSGGGGGGGGDGGGAAGRRERRPSVPAHFNPIDADIGQPRCVSCPVHARSFRNKVELMRYAVRSEDPRI
jgi:hypothetical protein